MCVGRDVGVEGGQHLTTFFLRVKEMERGGGGRVKGLLAFGFLTWGRARMPSFRS